MRKLLLGLLALGLSNICAAQAAGKKEEPKPAPPVVEEVKEVKFAKPQVRKIKKTKQAPPAIEQVKEIKSPVQEVKKSEKVKFAAPRKVTRKLKHSQELQPAPTVVEKNKTTN